MTRLLFLDFDGVLHPLDKIEVLHPHLWFCWAPLLVELLQPWPDVDIVVHSSWRTEFNDTELRQLLGELAPRVVGSTSALPKAEGIAAILNATRPKVKAHVVLDDDASLAAHPGLNVILCDPRQGISSEAPQAELRAWLLATAPPSKTPIVLDGAPDA
jgi:hypothetical protein